ncbi:MAG: cytochrome b/b6 domain-containing protein [Burkholderiaceae bacterium]|nr:cytochrome b/b6 domain-containing protein [Burkholderiaceae bacterium]
MNKVRTRVWDLPTRLFHWLLAGCVVASIVTVNIGGNAIGWHFRFGYAILALVLFRIVWGFAGPRYARFASFPPSPSGVIRYLRGEVAAPPGHSPLGALSVYALLAALCVQVGTGLFANDDIMWEGPLKPLVSNAASELLTRVHRINRFVVIALVVLHLAAIAFYATVRKKTLIRPMIGGDCELDAANAHPPADDGAATRLRALAIALGCVALVWFAVTRLQ